MVFRALPFVAVVSANTIDQSFVLCALQSKIELFLPRGAFALSQSPLFCAANNLYELTLTTSSQLSFGIEMAVVWHVSSLYLATHSGAAPTLEESDCHLTDRGSVLGYLRSSP